MSTAAACTFDIRRGPGAVCRFTPYLAGSRNALAIRLAKLGQREAALVAAQESVAIRRHLARAYPAVFNAALAQSLTSLAAILSALGQEDAAAMAAREAEDLAGSAER